MQCIKCGIDNSAENKFCINCGNEMTKANQLLNNNICESCGSKNELTSKYCIVCGEKLKILVNTMNEHTVQKFQHNQKSDKSKNRNKANSISAANKKHTGKTIGINPLLITIGVLFISITLVAVVNKWFINSEEDRYPIETKSANPIVEAGVFDIASKFVCSCGTCNEESLEVCKCATAVEERQFIRDYVERNQKKEDIVFALASKYGFLKSQFAGEFKKVDKSKIFETNQITIPVITLDNKKSGFNKTASISDKVTIYSAFMCNCGKCGIDELKDCNCSHPKGAQEVKKFIDEKISANKYTVQEVIELVNSKYGGKKT
jgi:hypothetical protein